MKINSYFLALVLFSSGCGAIANDPLLQTTAGGSILGAGIGAGTGAIIGNNISNGDVGESALLGGAIGVAAGAAIGAAYYHYQYEAAIDRNQDQIDANTEHIRTTQMEAEELRQLAINDSSKRPLNEDLKDQVYQGPTIGQYGR